MSAHICKLMCIDMCVYMYIRTHARKKDYMPPYTHGYSQVSEVNMSLNVMRRRSVVRMERAITLTDERTQVDDAGSHEDADAQTSR